MTAFPEDIPDLDQRNLDALPRIQNRPQARSLTRTHLRREQAAGRAASVCLGFGRTANELPKGHHTMALSKSALLEVLDALKTLIPATWSQGPDEYVHAHTRLRSSRTHVPDV